MDLNNALNIVKKRLKSILKVTVLGMIILYLILSFIYPQTYTSLITVLPPESNQPGISNLLTGEFNSLLTGSNYTVNSQLYMEILRSRTASLYVVHKLNLVKFYNAHNDIEAAQKLNNCLSMDLTKEGVIKLNVELTSNLIPMLFDNVQYLKKLSADISNTYIQALDSINKTKISIKAKKAREYLEVQLLQTKNTLDSTESNLAAFQKSNKTISLPDQVKASIESAAQLKAEIVKTEIDLKLAESNMNSDNKTLIGLKEKLKNLNSEYSKFGNDNQDYFLGFNNVPSIGKRLAGLTRDVKVQNEVYSMLEQQYFKEKIQENKDLPTVDILDEAIPPTKQIAPRPVFSSFAGGICLFIVMSFFYIIQEEKLKGKKVV